MANTKQEQLETFWNEVSRRAEMQLSDINIGVFHQWRETVGDHKINQLLKLMELLLCPENSKSEVTFLFDFINNKLNGAILFSCFNKSSRGIIKEGMKGDVYCMPILYVVICYFLNNTKAIPLSNHGESQEASINPIFQFKSKNLTHETK